MENISTTSMLDIKAIEESISCPITQLPMKNPVTGSDGQTYEREAIETWLREHRTSPHDRSTMNIESLKLNVALKFLCDKYHQECQSESSDKKFPTQTGTYNILLDHNLTKNEKNNVMLTFNVNPESFPKEVENNHLPQDIVLVIDHSGSMNLAVEAKDAQNNNIESGMSIQDIVNHAAKTVAKSLNKESRLAVICFDSTITIVFDLMLMTEINKANALDKIDTIKPRYQTNIWGGIEQAIKILDSRIDKTRNSAILMFTDGQPNISPARGEVETLKKLRSNKNFTTPIYTFGFGYGLQKELLYDMAKYANGANGHIPDGGMIATVFCNFTGTILSTVVMNLQLHIISKTKKDNSELIIGDFASNFDEKTNCYTYDLGTVQNEQEKNIILNTQGNEDFTYYYTYKICGQSFKSDEITVNKTKFTEISNDDNVNIHKYRFEVVNSIRKMINYNRIGQANMATEELYNIIRKLKENPRNTDHKLIRGLLINLEGQVNIAISNPTYFSRWGEFYLDQLSRSINQQIKPNFKDEGCPFGGQTFEDIVDRTSDIFDTLPPPTPSLINRLQHTSSSLGNRQPTVNMSDFNNQYGGCFHSSCSITMANGNIKNIKSIKKGDIVKTMTIDNNISESKVICVVETHIKNSIRKMCLIDGLTITPWHPIYYNNNWCFPYDLTQTVNVGTTSMITFVLEKDHIVFINDVPCITLGHNYENNEVLKHPYFGSNNVIKDLKASNYWSFGHINLYDDEIKFIKTNNYVTKMHIPIIKEPPTLVDVV
jgi:Mg-chelatase subunit ChlD